MIGYDEGCTVDSVCDLTYFHVGMFWKQMIDWIDLRCKVDEC